eukprot:TRINITY_DN12421_c0_g1_i3.p2 TRINITY_DN12421_c0_g1~~TRINITY_DN12421_c0_g1_i3.p2  ORF type:complete len:349 (+),score=77.23 TRINITY_DN12421_c0_g1_i3:97-1047(+)
MWSADTADLVADLLPALATICFQVALLNTPFLRRGLRRMRRDAVWVATNVLHGLQWGAAGARTLPRAAGGHVTAAAKGAAQRARHLAAHAKRAAVRSRGAFRRSARTRTEAPTPASRPSGAGPNSSSPTNRSPTNRSPTNRSPTNRSPTHCPTSRSPPGSVPAAGADCSPAGSPAKRMPAPVAASALLPLPRPRHNNPLQLPPTASPPRPRAASPTSFGVGDASGTPTRDRPAVSSSPPRIERFVYTQASSPELQPIPDPASVSPIRDGMSTPKAAGQPQVDPADRVVPGTPWVSQETLAQHSNYRMGGVQPLAMQ